MKESYGKGLGPALLSLTKTLYALFCQHLRWSSLKEPSRPPPGPSVRKNQHSHGGGALDIVATALRALC